MFSLIKLPQVFTINQVPKMFREDSIISGYRHPHSSATDCILSLFQLTNETLNIWTHFLPTWYFLWRLVTVVLTQTAWQDSYTWPMLVFLFSCCVYPLASSCAHTFSTMSPRARHICFFFDYSALSLYSLGSALSYSAYVFPDKWVNSTFHQYFVCIALFNTVVCTSLSCYSRFPECQSPKYGKVLRVVAFALPYLFDNIPLFYRVFLCSGNGCTDNLTNTLHCRHIALAFLTGFLFATHLPERLAPGSFDYIGHSHQLFHVCGITATHFQMKAIEEDMFTRRQWLLTHSLPTSFSNTLGVGLLCVVLNLGIIALYALPLLRSSDSRKQTKAKQKGTSRVCFCD